MMCLHFLVFYFMLIICYCTLPLHWWGLWFLSISLWFYNLCAYAFVILIWIVLLVYTLMLSFFMIPVNTTTMLLRWILLIHNIHLLISWKITILMNWVSSYSPVVIKITLEILWPRVTFLCMLSYFNVGGKQRVFILNLVIFSLSYLIKWDVEIIFHTGSSINQMIFMGACLQPLTI